MKKFVSMLLVCTMLITGVLAVPFVASAEESVSFDYADFENFIGILVGSLQAVTNRDVRAARFRFYLDTIGKHDSEIDERIAELNSGSALADTMLQDLIGGGMSKPKVTLILQVLKSLPEAERSAAVDEFYANQKNEAYYAFADPNSDEYDEVLVNSYKAIYDQYINAAFQATVLADYGLEYIDFVPFIRVVTRNIYYTRDSDGRIAILSVSDAFKDNILENATVNKVNGKVVKDEFTILDEIAEKFSDGVSGEVLGTFTDTFKHEDAYEIVGNFTGDANGDVNLLDAGMMTQYFAGWASVRADADAHPVRIAAGAAIHPDGQLSTADVVKLLQYLAGWPGIILGRTK